MNPFPFSNIEFFAVLVPAVLLTLAAKRLGRSAFKWIVIVFSVVVFAWLPGLRVPYAILCGSLIAVTLTTVALRSRHGFGLAVPIAMLWLAAAFVIVRADAAGWLLAIWPGAGRSLLPVFGFAFLVIKAYGLLIDVMSGRVTTVRAVDVVAYFAYFPTVIAGPIFRYADFVQQFDAAAALGDDTRRIAEHLPRLCLGAFKVMVVAALIEPWSISSLPAEVIAESPQRVYLGALTYYFFEYINFSGYTDMAIAVSTMIGLRPPENFNLPFLARNLTELWRRWHMSFASWLRDYVYFPINFQLASRFRMATRRGRAGSSAVAVFATFFFCGFWHGLSAGTMLFGVLSGLVLAIEAFVAGIGWRPAFAAVVPNTADTRVIRDGVRQLWTLHLASLTFAPVLLDSAQLAALGRLMGKVL